MNVVLPDFQHHNFFFVRYYFEGAPEHRIELKVHHDGNAKIGCIPYPRTYSSTVAKIKDAVSRNRAGLTRVVYQVEEDVRDLENCKSGGQLPRNQRQAKSRVSVKQSCKGSDFSNKLKSLKR